MKLPMSLFSSSHLASMGPRSENRGYQTCKKGELLKSIASMGPRSENRGYEKVGIAVRQIYEWLQWVHGPRTVVMPDKPV